MMNWIPYQRVVITTDLNIETLHARLHAFIGGHYGFCRKIGLNWPKQSIAGRYRGDIFKINYAEDGFDRIVCYGKISASIDGTALIHLQMRYNCFGSIIMLLLLLIFADSLITGCISHKISWRLTIPLLLYIALLAFFNYFTTRIISLIQAEISI